MLLFFHVFRIFHFFKYLYINHIYPPFYLFFKLLHLLLFFHSSLFFLFSNCTLHFLLFTSLYILVNNFSFLINKLKKYIFIYLYHIYLFILYSPRPSFFAIKYSGNFLLLCFVQLIYSQAKQSNYDTVLRYCLTLTKNGFVYRPLNILFPWSGTIYSHTLLSLVRQGYSSGLSLLGMPWNVSVGAH